MILIIHNGKNDGSDNMLTDLVQTIASESTQYEDNEFVVANLSIVERILDLDNDSRAIVKDKISKLIKNKSDIDKYFM